MLRLHPGTVDYVIIAIYFAVVLGIGFVARMSIKTDLDFFLSGRSLPAWITGLAFISANLGALEILGQSANGAQYGVSAVHYYWIGAVPAMVFLGLVMMPFYYGAKVRSVPEYLRLRFGNAAHIFNALTFAVATVLIGGVNLFALALIIHLLLGWPVGGSILAAAAIVLIYITLGGLTSAIYNEVLQFFVICAALIPLTLVALHSVGGWTGLEHRIKALPALGNAGLHAWKGLGVHHETNPLKANWIGVVFGLGFVVSFGYWTTNFAEVQRALSAKNLSAARRTPLIAAYPKIFLPAIIILPGLIAVATVHGLGVGQSLSVQYNTAIPHLISQFFPEGMLGIAIVALIAAFMAGVAANVTAFNTVVTYDLLQDYVWKDRDPAFYVRWGRLMTVGGILISIATAFIAKGYSNMMNYIQTLFSIFNVPLFTTFIVAMFWKRASAWGGFWSLVAGTATAYGVNRLAAYHVIFHFGSALSASFWQSIWAFIVGTVVLVAVSLVTKPKPTEELRGLVWGLDAQGRARGQRRPARPAVVALAGTARRRRDRDRGRAEHHLHLGVARVANIKAHPLAPSLVAYGADAADRRERRRRGRGSAGGQQVRHPPADRRAVLPLLGDPDRARAVRLALDQEQGGRDQRRPVDGPRDARVRPADDLLGAEPAGRARAARDSRPGIGADPARAGDLRLCRPGAGGLLERGADGDVDACERARDRAALAGLGGGLLERRLIDSRHSACHR